MPLGARFCHKALSGIQTKSGDRLRPIENVQFFEDALHVIFDGE
jgi:hypothetical protein